MTVPPALYHATYAFAEEPPTRLWVGEPCILRLQITNTGSVPWLHVGVMQVTVGHRWYTTNGTPVGGEGTRARLPHPVPPGNSVTVEVRADPPPGAGDYVLELSLIEEQITWFHHAGVNPVRVPITFAPPDVPRVCVLNGNCVLNDAVGNHIMAQLRTLRAAGYYALLLTEHVDQRLPADARRAMIQLQLSDLEQGHSDDPHIAPGITHFYHADVLILNYSTYYALAHAVKLPHGATVIFDYHGVTPTHLWDKDAPGYDNLVRGHRDMTLVQYADYAYGHSQYTADEVIATGLIPPERVGVMPYAVVPDAGYGAPPDTTLLERYHLWGKHVLLYVGRMARNKHIHDLVAAMPAILAAHSATVLLLVGDNTSAPYQTYLAEIAQQTADLGCSEQVIFTGQVPDVQLFYDLCHVFVTASVHEGFGMPAVEAMARGKPVVAARATGTPHVVGDAGCYFEPGDSDQLAAYVNQLLAEVAPHPPATPREHLRQTWQPPALRAMHTALAAQQQSTGVAQQPKIAFITPRYGREILGGAERLIRGYAEELTRRGHAVEVLTTCTLDMGAWVNHFQPGVETINGVLVRRFATSEVDVGVFHEVLTRANRGDAVRYADEEAFAANNLRSHDMVQYIAQHLADYRCLVFAPYLFGTTYWGIRAFPEHALLLPCLHDEPSARLLIFREMLEAAAGLLFNADAEMDVATAVLGVANPFRMTVGYGFDLPAPQGDGAAFRARHGLPAPILLYSGRLEVGKNVPLLLEYFTRYKDEHPGELTLVLTGRGDIPLPARADVVAVGMLPEHELPDAFAAALALCQPSRNESFSIVIMEAWLQGRPVLVHSDCAVTRQHVERSGGGLHFASYAEFAAALHHLLHTPAQTAAMGQRGYGYVVATYNWDAVCDRLLTAIERFAPPRSEYTRRAQRGVRQALQFSHRRFAEETVRVVGQAQHEQLPPAMREWYQQLVAPQQVPNNPTAPTVAPPPSLVDRVRNAWGALRGKTPPPPPPPANGAAAPDPLLRDAIVPLLRQGLAEQRRLQRRVDLLTAARQVDNQHEDDECG